MLRSILVPIDGSAFSASALPIAAALASRDGATLHLLTIYAPLALSLPLLPSAPESAAQYDAEQRTALRRALDARAERLGVEYGITVLSTVLDGEPAEVLISEAARRHVDLIVMTTHGRGGFTRAWLGSVADALLRRAPAPVLLIRRTNTADESSTAVAAADGTAAPQGTASHPTPAAGHFRHVLVPLDCGALAEEAVPPAMELATPNETVFRLLHVLRVAETRLPPERTFWLPLEVEAMRERRESAAAYLDRQATRLRAAGYEVDTATVLGHDPARAALHEADAVGADLIALSTHARGGVARVVLGSVADKIVRGANSPVLVVRPGLPPARSASVEAAERTEAATP